MYYEIYGSGQPLVLLHGNLSTITTSFDKVLPMLSVTRQLSAARLPFAERQGHIAGDIAITVVPQHMRPLVTQARLDRPSQGETSIKQGVDIGAQRTMEQVPDPLLRRQVV
jgi:hypothetical protein